MGSDMGSDMVVDMVDTQVESTGALRSVFKSATAEWSCETADGRSDSATSSLRLQEKADKKGARENECPFFVPCFSQFDSRSGWQ